MTTQKTVLITGANKGIGLETAKQLLQLGYRVYIGSRNLENGLKAVADLKKLGFSNIDTIQLDVTNAKSIDNAKKQLQSKITHLDILINNAGISGTMPQNASDVSMDNLRTVYETNFFGVIQTTQSFLDLLKLSNEPRIVNVSSDLGSLTNHGDKNYTFYDVKLMAYCSSKTALNAFTVMLAYDLRNTNFKVNSVNPGFTATDLNGFTGSQTVEQAAKVIVDYAIIDNTGPTGGFYDINGILPW